MLRRVAVVVVVAAAFGWLFSSWSNVSEAPLDVADPVQPEPRLVTARVIGELAEDLPLRLRLGGVFNPSSGKLQKLLFLTQLHYPGELTESAVAAVLRAGKPHALEHRLGPSNTTRLESAMRGLDTTLRDVALVIEEEQTRIKNQLRSRADRRLTFDSVPQKGSPEYRSLETAQLELGNKGALWPEPHGNGVLYLKVRWSEWPGLKALIEDRDYVLRERTQTVRGWIAREYEVHGMNLFSQ